MARSFLIMWRLVLDGRHDFYVEVVVKDMHLEVVEIPIGELVPYENNANIHSEHQIDQIVASIEEFGFTNPVLVWENADGQAEVVAGHGRVLAAKKLRMDKVPVIYLNALTDDQRRALTHIDNQLTRNSEFDWELLQDELSSLDFDWENFGFEIDEIDQIVEEFDEDYEIEKDQEPDIPFTDYIDESKNYVVLKFDNKKDWLHASSVLGLETVQSLPTRTDGVQNNNFRFTGIGRVLDGVKAMQKIVSASKGLE